MSEDYQCLAGDLQYYFVRIKVCSDLTSFSPFNAAPFNGPFLFSIVFMKNGPFFYRMGIEPNLPVF